MTGRKPVEQALATLRAMGKKVKPSGKNQWLAQCPAHNDQNPSLGVSEGKDGLLLLHCFAGCTFESILDAMGLRKEKANMDSEQEKFKDELIIQKYHYCDENGKLLYYTCRTTAKKFPPQMLDGTFKLKCKRVLYRLPELIASTGQVFLVEGEKDTDRLRSLDLTATTNMGGSKAWQDEYAEVFRGRDVVIVPDNDEAGRTWRKAVESSLRGVVQSIKVVELPGLEKAQDVSDWLDNGGTKDGLLEIVRQTGRSKVKLKLTRLADVESESVDWFWDNKIPANTFSIISGDPGATKSYLTAYMAAMVTTGQAWPDCPDIAVDKGSVVFFSEEDHPSAIIKPRLEAHGADMDKVFVLESVHVSKTKESFDITRHLAGLEDTLEQLTDCRLVVFDPVTAYLGNTNANSNSDVRGALSPLVSLATKHKVTVIGINHHNKRQDMGGLYRGLGSTAFVAQARSVWAVMKDKSEPSGEMRIFCPVKANYCINPTGLRYQIIDNTIVFESEPWIGCIDDLSNSGEKSKRRVDEAANWLKERLGAETVKSTIIFEEGKEAGFNKDLLNRAKPILGIKCDKDGFGGQWLWRLPENE